MDDSQRIVKCGSLSLHSSGSFFKRWQAKYLVLYDGSKSGIKRLELFDSEIKFKKQIPAKIIPLVECIRVVTCQRQKTTYTFEVRTNEQFYLLAAQSFQDMNDWVNCLRLVAFGSQTGVGHRAAAAALVGAGKRAPPAANHLPGAGVDVLLEKRTAGSYLADRKATPAAASQEPPSVPTETHPVLARHAPGHKVPVASTTASQAAAAAASAFAKTRQRQPSLLGSVKPQPPADSPFIQPALAGDDNSAPTGTGSNPTPLCGQQHLAAQQAANHKQAVNRLMASAHRNTLTGLDEEEENMLYCSIEDNPSEHNYRVKVIETELSLRCQLKCYQLSAPTTISQQYEQLGQFQQSKLGQSCDDSVTFYQLLVGPEELILLNDYGSSVPVHQSFLGTNRQQGLWSWPYQCIRRYGFDKDNCFMFEAGRKCSSGPGQFIVQTPKAYNIYQDVVAFVNKLKSSGVHATSALMLEPVPEASQQAEADLQQNNNTRASITQIPVTWTPLICGSEQQQPAQPVSMERRKQFFSSLQQQQSTQKSSTGSELVDTTSNDLPTGATQQTNQIAPSGLKHDSQAKVACTESAGDRSGTSETDESGYEHGDESVDSNKWARREPATSNGSPAHANKKRQPPASSDSMSSASSTSSGGSPGHSVSRRANFPAQQQPIKDRPQLLLNNTELTNQNQDSVSANDKRRPPVRLGAILDSLARENSEDFEANLIRDVYSEINKLHAKFAVTSGSVDDSMSSHSSNEGSGEQEQDENNLSPGGMVVNVPPSDKEYGNMNRNLSRSRSDLNMGDGRGDEFGHTRRDRENYKPANGSSVWVEKYRPQYSSNSYHHQISNSFEQYKPNSNQTAYCAPMYPTILNPIPECGEPTVVVHQPSKSPRVMRRHPSNLTNSNTRQPHTDDMTRYKDNLKQARNHPMRHHQNSNMATVVPTPCAGSLIPKLPTKHYVINDVQYAKISRNVGSKIESCL